MARYLAARANAGASVATMRLATSAITKAHEWAKQESPCRDPGVGASLNRRKVRVCCTCLKVVLGSKSELLLVNTVPKDLDV